MLFVHAGYSRFIAEIVACWIIGVVNKGLEKMEILKGNIFLNSVRGSINPASWVKYVPADYAG